MTENYEHYITRNIRAFYRRRLFSPLLLICILAALWILFPLRAMLFPRTLSEEEGLLSGYRASETFVKGEFFDLTFCGYTREAFGRTSGYYYYGMRGGQCVILLLTPGSCEEGMPVIDQITLTCRIMEGGSAYSMLLGNLAEDLSWTQEGMEANLSPYYFSEPGYERVWTVILFIVYFGTLLVAVGTFLLYLFYSLLPQFSRPVMDLAIYGNPRQMLQEAEEELLLLPQLATEDMFITEHYFIMTSPDGNAIVPIKEILWIYKYSTLHKFLWYVFSISYTLRIYASKHFYVKCPKNLKSDIDGIMDYLAEANHSIVVGFSEENRVKVQSSLGKPFHIEKIAALLRKRV